jgi:general secretion pathway protein C
VVERGAVEQIIQNYAKLAGSLRTRPTKEGMRLSGLKPDNVLSKLGMKNGDLLQSINGFDMSDPEKAVDAYAKLRSAGKLDITVNRDGAPFTVGISIQ